MVYDPVIGLVYGISHFNLPVWSSLSYCGLQKNLNDSLHGLFADRHGGFNPLIQKTLGS